jgi:di/tricarboxylate transporter
VIRGIVDEKLPARNYGMSLHTLHLIIVFALVVGVFVAFVREWVSPDLVGLSALGLLLVTGILGTDEALKVFSNSAPAVIGCMFVLSAALERTGVIDALARVFLRLAGASELRALVALAVFTVPLSLLLSTTRRWSWSSCRWCWRSPAIRI